MALPISTKFAETDDVLKYLQLFIQDDKTLFNLCLTSRAFNGCFTRALYANLTIRIPFQPRLEALQNNSGLRYVRSLTLLGDLTEILQSSGGSNWLHIILKQTPLAKDLSVMFRNHWVPPDRSGYQWHADIAMMLQTIHHHCPGLEALHIDDWNCDHRYSDVWNSTDRTDEDGGTLVDYTGARLGRLSITGQDFSNLANLRVLHITNIGGQDCNIWQDVLVNMLKAAPGLRELWLSRSYNSLYTEDVPTPQFRMESVCEKFAKIDGTALKLTSLRLGTFVFLCRGSEAQSRQLLKEELITGMPTDYYDDDNGHPATYLARLTDLKSLKEIHVANKRSKIKTVGIGHGYIGIVTESDLDPAWNTFTPELTPNLRVIRVDGYEHNLRVALEKMPHEFLSQLAVYPEYKHRPFSLLNLRARDADGWHLYDGQPTCKHVRLLPLRMLHCVGDDTTHNTHACHEFDWSCVTSWSLPPTLEGLSMSDVRDKHSMKLLVMALAGLPKLRAFSIKHEYFSGDERYLRHAEVLDQERSLEAAVALEIAEAVKALEFIEVGGMRWRITRVEGGVGLDEMNDIEAHQLELFRMMDFDIDGREFEEYL